MKHLIALSLLTTFSLSAFAKDSILTCTIQNPKTKQAATVKMNLNKITTDEANYSKGIDSGKDNYSFNLTVTKSKKEFQIDAVFQENNSVQDEVGGTSCVYTTAIGKKSFCYETLTADNDWTVAIFYCQVK
jgi:hypothetical protein